MQLSHSFIMIVQIFTVPRGSSPDDLFFFVTLFIYSSINRVKIVNFTLFHDQIPAKLITIPLSTDDFCLAYLHPELRR